MEKFVIGCGVPDMNITGGAARNQGEFLLLRSTKIIVILCYVLLKYYTTVVLWTISLSSYVVYCLRCCCVRVQQAVRYICYKNMYMRFRLGTLFC